MKRSTVSITVSVSDPRGATKPPGPAGHHQRGEGASDAAAPQRHRVLRQLHPGPEGVHQTQLQSPPTPLPLFNNLYLVPGHYSARM